MQSARYQAYLSALKKPFKKLSKLEFLQPDGSVAFMLDNQYQRGYNSKYDSRAFIQGGTLNVSLQNGARRSANITLSNLDNAFDYSVNKLWYGSQVRLSMGLLLPDGTDFYLPQGVFYIKNPRRTIRSDLRQISYNLVDKWSALDGTLLGRLPYSYTVNTRTDAFKAVQSILAISKYDLKTKETDPFKMLDSTQPVFSMYYYGLPDISYPVKKPDGSIQTLTIPARQTPYSITENMGSTFGALLLKLNEQLVGWIGYDPTGALRIDSGTESIIDANKPILWTFTPQNSNLLEINESDLNTEALNDIIVVGETTIGGKCFGRATNYDPASNINVNLIGMKSQTVERPDLWLASQCVDYARWYLKKHGTLEKNVTISSSQMFHLIENQLVAIQRTDKPGAPIETHLINSFSLPIGETGSMTINATSVQDFDVSTVVSSADEMEENTN